MNVSNPLAALDSPLHIQWREDRALRQRVRLGQSWRGCMGLAVMLDPAATIHTQGGHRLIANHALTWVALRDIPVGHWHFEPSRQRREVNYVTTAVAGLRFGMPRIDFGAGAPRALDFRLCPFGTLDRHLPDGRWRRVTARGDVLNSDNEPRLFAVLNRMSAAMTRFAFTAVTSSGTPVRPAWFARRPVKEQLPPSISPRDWMPRPLLGFGSEKMGSVPRRILDHALCIPGRPNRLYFPAFIVARVAREARSVDLLWDMTPAQAYLHCSLDAAVFPPLRLGAWNGLRWCLAEVDVDARIGDPRLEPDSPGSPASLDCSHERCHDRGVGTTRFTSCPMAG